MALSLLFVVGSPPMVAAVQGFPVARVDLPDGLPGMNMSDPRGDVVPKNYLQTRSEI